MLSTIHACAREGMMFLGLPDDTTPAAAIGAIDQFVRRWEQGQTGLPTSVDAEDIPYSLGCMWGQQLVKQFDWEWAMVTYHEQEGARAPGVVSPDRSLMLCPIHFLAGCLEGATPGADIAGSYRRLENLQDADTSPGAYVDLMRRNEPLN